jgi:hypothetical protein
MFREPKLIVPPFEVRLTPVPPEVVTDVLAKFNVPLELPTLMPIPVEPLMVVEPVVKLLPATRPVRLIPVVVLLLDEMLPKLAFRVPVERFSALPVPFNVTSEMFSVPKPVPLISEAELPPVNPRNVLPEATVIPLVMMFTMFAPGFGGGKASLPVAGVKPIIEARVAVASCPMNF